MAFTIEVCTRHIDIGAVRIDMIALKYELGFEQAEANDIPWCPAGDDVARSTPRQRASRSAAAPTTGKHNG